jgi:tRNA(Ile)-lysidine synthetase-like protein
MDDQSLSATVAAVPTGSWAVGVSGGADSVALLLLLQQRQDLSLHIVHLDHQTRNGQSAEDAKFVAQLADRLTLPCTIALRSQIDLPPIANLSARFRSARIALFKQVVEAHSLSGVILAHHADDQAETVLQRLLRGAGPTALTGMFPRTMIGNLCILRPLLQVPSADLRHFLQEQNQEWRQDISNTSLKYLRNCLRPILAANPVLRDTLLNLAAACRQLRGWIKRMALVLPEQFQMEMLASLPPPLARHAAGRWLADRGVPHDRITANVCDHLIAMAADAASAPRAHFPAGLLVRRRRGIISVSPPRPSSSVATASPQMSPLHLDSDEKLDPGTDPPHPAGSVSLRPAPAQARLSSNPENHPCRAAPPPSPPADRLDSYIPAQPTNAIASSPAAPPALADKIPTDRSISGHK